MTPVRLTGDTSISMCDVNADLPTGFTQDEANDLYYTTSQDAGAPQRVMALRSGFLQVSASAGIVTNDVRILMSDWKGPPDPLPVFGLQQAPVSKFEYTMTPKKFTANVEFFFPGVPSVVRRS
jgi:hypothetical protein